MNNKTIKISASLNDINKRLDVFLSEKIKNLTRTYIKKIISIGGVRINSVVTKFPSKKIRLNDEICFEQIIQKEREILPKKVEFEILYHDEDVIVINKPVGLVVHPGAGNYDNTLVNGLLYKFKNNLSNLSGKLRPGIIHRIDKNTSGIIVIAKNNISHSNLGKQFHDHSIERDYLGLVWGSLRPLNGKIETLITRSDKNRQLMTNSDKRGKKAITNYQTLKVYFSKKLPKVSLVQFRLETGRTHQIRVHMNYKKTSLIGDMQYRHKKYNFKKIDLEFEKILNNLKGQALHAEKLNFIHPTKKKLMKFKCNPPALFQNMLNLFEKLTD
tara:strand:+ start:74 stop:1057 length:984 start_codon:yes stop_codon:yes gene_type:complete